MPLLTARVAVLVSLLIWWLNVILTRRWADVPGSIHGWRRPFFIASLAVLTLMALRQRAWTPVALPRVWLWTSALGAALLVTGFFCWFPPHTWHQIPFLDNWVPRYQSTIDQVALMRRGAFVGWNWWFLGGYQLSSDITQNLGVPAFPFVILFGPQLGFHLLHGVLFAAIPVLVFADIRGSEDRESATLAAALACLLTTGYCFSAVRSGDTNSLAAVCTTALAIVAIHQAYQERPYGPPLLAIALALTAYAHLGFFAYAVGYCTLHCVYYRDRRGLVLLAAAILCACVATLPLMWENWTRPSFFSFNNVLLHPPESFQWGRFARQFYYNVEVLARPGRWFNDYTTPIRIFLPVVLLLAIQTRRRVAFHAWAALATLALMTLNYSEFGFAFSRPFHMLPVFTAPVLAGFIVGYGGSLRVAVALVVSLALYVALTFSPVPHVNRLEDWDAALVTRIRTATAGMVLIENSPHLDMIESPAVASPKTPFGAHFEPLLPASTGRRFYAGFWDGWQWTVYRQNLLAAGAMWGRSLSETPPGEVVKELERWGIQDVFAWSPAARQFFAASSEFEKPWETAAWQHFRRGNADTRSVVTTRGSGELVALHPLGARIELRDVDGGADVIVRTNYYPVWSAYAGSDEIRLFEANGQLAFRAPRSGSYDVHLIYPRRLWLLALAIVGFLSGVAALYYTQSSGKFRRASAEEMGRSL